MKRFALTGLAGYIAPRHLEAIRDTGNVLSAALDPHDSVGIIDRYFPEADFFTEFERFDRHLEKMRRHADRRIEYLTICSPNYLHDAHVRFGLRIGADVICEKPLVLNPWNADALAEAAAESGRRINVIMQLRLHEAMSKLWECIEAERTSKKHEVELTYIAPRGRWYSYSWKGQEPKSGGIATNIGIHFFDLLGWIFGRVERNAVHLRDERRAAGLLELEKARVRWFLSLRHTDLPQGTQTSGSYKRLKVDGQEIDLSSGFESLHTESYRRILSGQGLGPADVKQSIETVTQIRIIEPIMGAMEERHEFLKR